MAPAKSRVGLTIALGVLFGLGAGLSYVFYFHPRQTRSIAQSEVKEWSSAWERARRCLIPAEYKLPLLARFDLAVLNRKPGEGQFPNCANRIIELARKPGHYTEDPAIEASWDGMRAANAKLKQAELWARAEERERDLKSRIEGLHSAIVEMHEAANNLRKSVGLKALSALPSGSISSLTQEQELGGPKPGSGFASDMRVSPHDIQYFWQGEDARFRVVHMPQNSTYEQISPYSLRALGGDWGLWLEFDGMPTLSQGAPAGAILKAGGLDAQGDPTEDGIALATLSEGESLVPSFAIGDQKRAIIFRHDRIEGVTLQWENRMLYSVDGGQSYEERKLPDSELWTQLREHADHNYILWSAPETPRTIHFLGLSGAGLSESEARFPGTRSAHGQWPPDLCLSDQHKFWILENQVYYQEAAGPLLEVSGKLADGSSGFSQRMHCEGNELIIASTRQNSDLQTSLVLQTCNAQSCSEELHRYTMPATSSYQVFRSQGHWAIARSLRNTISIQSVSHGAGQISATYSYAGGPIWGALPWKGKIGLILWQDSPVLWTAPDLVH